MLHGLHLHDGSGVHVVHVVVVDVDLLVLEEVGDLLVLELDLVLVAVVAGLGGSGGGELLRLGVEGEGDGVTHCSLCLVGDWKVKCEEVGVTWI